MSEPPSEKAIVPIEKVGDNLPSIPDYIPAEVFLENMGFFTPSSTRIKEHQVKEKIIGEKVALDGTKKLITVSISANAKLGLPITSDLDYYRAFLKICDEVVDREGRFQLPIKVPSKRLASLAGKEWSGYVSKEIGEWFDRMNFTGIKGGVYRAKSKTYDDGFTGVVFSQVFRRGQPMKNGTTADTNYVWPSPWFLSNYYYRYLRPIDLNFHRRLTKPIAKALYPLLETGWYASNGNPYNKSYQDLCNEFLLTPYRNLSRIKQQLDPAHEELRRERFLESWEYREAAEKGDFVITYYPGAKFFEDQRARIGRGELAKQISRGSRKEQGRGFGPMAPVHLISEILAVTGDKENIKYYGKVIRELSEHTIWEIISLTKQAKLEGRINTTAARYFTDLAKRARKKSNEEQPA